MLSYSCFYPDYCKIKQVAKNYIYTKKNGVFIEKDQKL